MVKEEKCEDVNCPIHGSLKTRGRNFKGFIVSAKAQKTAIVEWVRVRKILKYDRYEKRKTRIQVHNPSCINAKEGDYVKVKECRPLSKTKKFVIVSLAKEKDNIEEPTDTQKKDTKSKEKIKENNEKAKKSKEKKDKK